MLIIIGLMIDLEMIASSYSDNLVDTIAHTI